MNKFFTRVENISYLVVALAVLLRFVPHLPNFTPVFGALLFGGAYLARRDAVWFPVALLAVSDVILTTVIYGMAFRAEQLIIWAAFALIALTGYALRGRITSSRVLGAAILGPVLFFLISNFAVWLGGALYPATAAGLMAAYVAAIPFFGNSLASSLMFSAFLFGAMEWMKQHGHLKAGHVSR